MNHHSDSKPSVAITGAGICGLCCGVALAQAGHSVTIIERDTALPEGDADAIFFEWIRRGASQFKHPHAFLGVMSNLLSEMFPDLIDFFWAAGARKITFAELLP
jgi:predicted NAD/FAD-binding protein